MSRTLTVILVILLVAGIAAFAILNQPANMLIRDTLGRIQEMTVVSQSDLDQMRLDNVVLRDSVNLLHREQERRDVIIQTQKSQLAESQLKTEELQKKLSEVEIIVPDTANYLVYFDKMTGKDDKSILMGEVVHTTPERIMRANTVFARVEFLGKRSEIQTQIIQSLHKDVRKLETIVGTLEETNLNCLHRLDLKRRQIHNWEQAEQDLIDKANRRARVAYGVTVAVTILNLIL